MKTFVNFLLAKKLVSRTKMKLIAMRLVLDGNKQKRVWNRLRSWPVRKAGAPNKSIKKQALQIRLSTNDHGRIISLIVPQSIFNTKIFWSLFQACLEAWDASLPPSPWVSSPIPYDNKVINLIHFYNTISNNLYGFCDSSPLLRFFWYSWGFVCFSWLGNIGSVSFCVCVWYCWMFFDHCV